MTTELKPLAPAASAAKPAAPKYPPYALHSAPSSFVFKTGKSVNCVDGIIRATNDDEENELAASAEAGCIFALNEEQAEAAARQVVTKEQASIGGLR